MRFCAFHSRSVGTCTCQSTRLCTCSRSTCSRRRSRSDRCICSMPARLPPVQTFVATKASSRSWCRERRSPTTSSALPYIGELSTTRPPQSNSASSTWPRCAIPTGSRPTSNPSHVPQPMTGSGIAVEGMRRVCMHCQISLECGAMHYRNLGKSNLKVSVLCLGTMMFGDQTPVDDARRIVDDAQEHGVNYIDTADVYTKGASETMLGELLKGRRHHWVLATKLGNPLSEQPNEGHFSRAWMLRELDASLARLQMDHVG